MFKWFLKNEKLNLKIKLDIKYSQFWNVEISVVLHFVVPNVDPRPSLRAITGFPMLNSILIFLSRSSPQSFASHSFRPFTTFSCTARCTSLQLHICTSVSFTLHSRHLLSLNPLFRSLPMLPHLSLAHVSLISPLIFLSSQYFSISIPSFLFLYSSPNFDLSILFQSFCIFWSVLILIPLSIFSSNSSLLSFFIVSHILLSPNLSIAILNSFPHFVGFRFEIPLIFSL